MPQVRVLFVDDEEACREAFVRSLINRNIAVDVASTGSEAVEKASRTPYDVIAVDIDLPDQDGFSVIENIRARRTDTPFMIVSGLADVGLTDRPALDAVVSIVTKPWDPAELLELITRAAGSTGRAKEVDEAAPSILLVEDCTSDANLVMSFAARAWGSRSCVTHVERVADAIRLLKARSFDVIVTDLGLPDARGLDAIYRLQHARPDVPMVILSGLADGSVATHAIELGAQEYLQKERLDARSLQRTLTMAIERKRAETQLVQAAHYDLLTGLPNRTLFYERLRPVVSRCRRDQSRFAVLFIDLNGFKLINDQYGHAAGDFVLQTAARRIVDTVRDYDTAARLGGDEFVVLLEGIQDAGAAFDVAERIRQSIAEPLDFNGQRLTASASVGVGIFPDEAETTGDLMRHADEQMYTEKSRDRADSEQLLELSTSTPVSPPDVSKGPEA